MIDKSENTESTESKANAYVTKLSTWIGLAYVLFLSLFFTPNVSTVLGISWYLTCLVAVFYMVMRMVHQLLTDDLRNFPFYAGLLTFSTLFMAHYPSIKSEMSGYMFVCGVFGLGLSVGIIADTIIRRRSGK